MVKLNNDWDNLLKTQWSEKYYINLKKILRQEYTNYNIFPNMNDIYNAFKFTSYDKIKVVILGQDPYHKKDQAHGLSFSIKSNIKKPPSLINIFKEIQSDINIINNNGDLTNWTKEGVLLLNTCLTVRENLANSHKDIGWFYLTDYIIKLINQKEEPVVFILWGKYAYSKKKLINNPKHLILYSSHPSPLSAMQGFFGCKHFSKTNNFLISNGFNPINWQT